VAIGVTTIQVIEVPGWMLGMLNRNHWVRERNRLLMEAAAEARDVLLDMRLPCKCGFTPEHELVICERCRLSGLLADMENLA
jgi:hypothetical protein